MMSVYKDPADHIWLTRKAYWFDGCVIECHDQTGNAIRTKTCRRGCKRTYVQKVLDRYADWRGFKWCGEQEASKRRKREAKKQKTA